MCERHQGAVAALKERHREDLANLEAKRRQVIDEAAPCVGLAVGLRRIVDYLEREREQFKADLLRFRKQLDVAKASADLIKVMDALKGWVKGWTKLEPNLLPAPPTKLLDQP